MHPGVELVVGELIGGPHEIAAGSASDAELNFSGMIAAAVIGPKKQERYGPSGPAIGGSDGCGVPIRALRKGARVYPARMVNCPKRCPGWGTPHSHC